MAKKIPNVSRWGQDKARERYQFGGFTAPGLPVQANPAAAAAMANRPVMPTAPQAAAALAARPALPAQAMGRWPFKRGGKIKRQEGGGVKKEEVKPLSIKPPGMPQSEMNKILSGAQKDWVEGKYKKSGGKVK